MLSVYSPAQQKQCSNDQTRKSRDYEYEDDSVPVPHIEEVHGECACLLANEWRHVLLIEHSRFQKSLLKNPEHQASGSNAAK